MKTKKVCVYGMRTNLNVQKKIESINKNKSEKIKNFEINKNKNKINIK